MLDSQSQHLVKKADIEQSLSSLSGLEARITQREKDGLAVQEVLENHVPKVVSFMKDMSGLADKVSMHDAEWKSCACKVSSLESSVQARFADEARKRHGKLDVLQQELSRHRARIDGLDGQCGDLSKKAREWSSGRGHLRQGLEDCIQKMGVFTKSAARLEERVSVHDTCVKEHAAQIRAIGEGWKTSQKERLAELRVVCNQLESHEAQLGGLHSEIHAESGLVKAMADINSAIHQVRVDVSQSLEGKAPLSTMQELQEVVQSWISDARRSHDSAVEGLKSSLEELTTSNSDHGVSIERQQTWMNDLSSWLDQGRARDTVIAETLLHIVEEDHPDLMVCLEKRLKAVAQGSN